APQRVLREVILDHTWFGAQQAPAGRPPSRAPATMAPSLSPGSAEAPRVGPLFFGLAGALVLVCALAPVVARRLARPQWQAMAAMAGGAAVIGLLALLQPQPRALVDVWAIVRAESDAEGRPVSM